MMICIGAGIKAQSEYSTSSSFAKATKDKHGRIDLILEFEKIIYVIEIKFNKTAQEALEQIEERKYHTRFMRTEKSTIVMGLNFQREPNVFGITYALKKI